MKKAILLCMAALVLAGCSGRNSGSGDDDRNPDAGQLCGAYTEQREPTEEEMALFNEATLKEEMILTPLSVSTQVVAGINYKFWCRYQDNDTSGHCWVVIYKPLPGRGEACVTSISISSL